MSEIVRLEVPARAEVLSLVRLQVGAVAAITGALVTTVEDLQLATEELCLTLLPADGRDVGTLFVEVEWDDAAIVVRCALDAAVGSGALDAAVGSGAVGAPLEEADDDLPADVVERILDALVDEHGVAVEGGRAVRWLRARREPGRPGA